MTDEKLQHYKEKLLAKREEIRQSLQEYADFDSKTGNYKATYKDVGDDYDENAYEVTTYGRDQALEETLEEQLHQIDRALQRIEDGTYGVCQKTGQEISEERLEAYPEAEEAIASVS